ncbi:MULTISPECIES: hypothetical protein [Streptomyces]|nr:MULTISPECIES: hypothetical protein [Streptomyces]
MTTAPESPLATLAESTLVIPAATKYRRPGVRQSHRTPARPVVA